MPSREDVVTFLDPPVPEGASPWVGTDPGPSRDVAVVPPDHAWDLWADTLTSRVRRALGWRVLALEHVGSTSVPGLAAKPIIDLDLIVADTDDEAAYVPALQAAGFELRVREPWWYGHRLLRHSSPRCHLHVFGPDAAEPVRHRLFRDWLRGNPDDRELYARVKAEAAEATRATGGHGMDYNARKEAVVRDIYDRMFAATGLIPKEDS